MCPSFLFSITSTYSLFSGEIAELKTGFKHEVHFNNLSENVKTEILTWGVDSNIMVPPGSQTEANIVIEEMNYTGGYTLVSTLSGVVTVSIRRTKDGKFFGFLWELIRVLYRVTSTICHFVPGKPPLNF